MKKSQNNKKASEANAPADGQEAYTNAQKLLKDLKKGFIPYDNIFTSSAEALAAFPRLIGGDLLDMIGHQFYWERQPGKPLILYGQSSFKEEVQKKGLVEICRFRVSDTWIGVGRFKIDWPEMEKKDDQTPFLITLYLYSISTLDFDYLISNDDATARLWPVFSWLVKTLNFSMNWLRNDLHHYHKIPRGWARWFCSKD